MSELVATSSLDTLYSEEGEDNDAQDKAEKSYVEENSEELIEKHVVAQKKDVNSTEDQDALYAQLEHQLARRIKQEAQVQIEIVDLPTSHHLWSQIIQASMSDRQIDLNTTQIDLNAWMGGKRQLMKLTRENRQRRLERELEEQAGRRARRFRTMLLLGTFLTGLLAVHLYTPTTSLIPFVQNQPHNQVYEWIFSDIPMTSNGVKDDYTPPQLEAAAPTSQEEAPRLTGTLTDFMWNLLNKPELRIVNFLSNSGAGNNDELLEDTSNEGLSDFDNIW